MKKSILYSLMLFFITIGLTSNAQKPKKVAHKKNNAKIAVVHRTSNGNGLATAKTTRKRAKRARLVHHHYKHLPKRGALVTTVHSKAMVVTFGGIGYRHYSGVWYKPQGKKWLVIRSPFGVRVKVLPIGHRRCIVRNRTYYYYYGTYYIKTNNEYEWKLRW